jgi:glycosyltransferase involved in cell wall biosynthesis
VPRIIAGKTIPPETRVITYAARGLESMRGFDLFLRVARRIASERSDVLFVVAGAEKTYYGWDQLATGESSFKSWAVTKGEYDISNFLFLGQIPPEQLAEVFCLSDLHIYLTVPFVLSWSLINAMSSGCLVLASDVAPVREVIEPGKNGLVEPLFDTEGMAETALRALKYPGSFEPLRQAARERIESKYSLDVAIPDFKEYFERVVAKRH